MFTFERNILSLLELERHCQIEIFYDGLSYTVFVKKYEEDEKIYKSSFVNRKIAIQNALKKYRNNNF